MKSHPILFSAPMVRALLDGSKTQTRRIVKPQPAGITNDGIPFRFTPQDCELGRLGEIIRCPYGQIGDQLWVRETWGVLYEQFINESHEPTFWRADYSAEDLAEQKAGTLWLPRWRPSIHMFRNRSRITLEITGVRVERLQDISVDNCYAEGAHLWATENADRFLGDGGKYRSIIQAYKALWESINGAGSWDLNPWVWVIEFKKVKP